VIPGVAALLLAGTWTGCLIGGPWPLAVAGPVLVLGAARRTFPPPVRLLLVLVGLVVTGAGLAGGRAALLDSGPLARLAGNGGEAAVAATVVTDPRATEFGAWTLVRVSSVDGLRTRARALLRLNGIDGAPAVGQRVAFRATGRPLTDEGFEGHIRRLHAGVALTPQSPVRVTARAGPQWRVTNHVRARVREAADWSLPAEEAALLTGLVTGDVGGQPAERQEQFRDAGLTHLVAVSGSNVALVLAGVLGLCGVVGVGARGRRLTGIAAVCWFVLLVRAEPSVLRAALMAVLVLLAGLRGRGTRPPHVLAMAALLLLLSDPFLSGQLGFGLSVGATAGVLILAPRLAASLPGPRPVRVLIGASLGAQLGVAPILLTLPEGVGIWSLPANLVAVPAAAVASILGVAAALIAQVSVAGAGVIAVLARPALRVVIWAAETFAAGPRLHAGHLATPVAALLLAVILTRRRAPRLAAAALLLTVVAAVMPHLRTAGPVAVVTLTALDVGQGDALLVETPAGAGRAGARMLVDGGPEPGATLAALRGTGVRGLDAIALTHPHADHAGGLPAVLAALPVAVLLVGPLPLEPDTAPPVAETYAMAGRRGVRVLPVAAGAQFPLGGASVEVLSPPADGSLGPEPNDNSLVLRVAGSGGTALLTGDAEIAAQERLLRDPGRLRADVLKVPHHGGDTNAPGFLEAVEARAAVLSVGAGNDYGHPDADVLADLTGIAMYRTDRHGAVRIELHAGGPTVVARARAPPTLRPCPAAVHRSCCSSAPRSYCFAGQRNGPSRNSAATGTSTCSTSAAQTSVSKVCPIWRPLRCSELQGRCWCATPRSSQPRSRPRWSRC